MKGFDAWLTTQPEPDPICSACHGNVEVPSDSPEACFCPEECPACGIDPGVLCLDPPGGICYPRFTPEQHAVIEAREKRMRDEYEREAQPEPSDDEPAYEPTPPRVAHDEAAADFAYDAARERRMR